MYIYTHMRSKAFPYAAKSRLYLRSQPQLLLSNVCNVTQKEKFKTTRAHERLASSTSFSKNLEDDSFKHGQHRKRKEDLLISSSYSYKMEKAVIKLGICTMETVLLALPV